MGNGPPFLLEISMTNEPCRRRPIWAARGEALPAVAETAQAEGIAPNAAAKGECPHCGRRIGRGLKLHIRWCKAKSA